VFSPEIGGKDPIPETEPDEKFTSRELALRFASPPPTNAIISLTSLLEPLFEGSVGGAVLLRGFPASASEFAVSSLAIEDAMSAWIWRCSLSMSFFFASCLAASVIGSAPGT
jgi:hypothetical protein